MRANDMIERALAACRDLEAQANVLSAEIVGSMRRGKPDVGDLDLLVLTSDPWTLAEKTRQRKQDGPRDHERMADVFIATPETYGSALARSTGPLLLNLRLVARAAERGLLLDIDIPSRGVYARFNPFSGLYAADDRLVPTPTEASFFRALDLPHVPPAYREWLAERI